MNEELYHHGVLGMKWGIRRYQPYPKGKKPKGAKEIGEANKFSRHMEKKIKANPEKYKRRQEKLENSKIAKRLGESSKKRLSNSKAINRQTQRLEAMKSFINKSPFFKKVLAMSTSNLGSSAKDGDYYIHHILQPQILNQQASSLANHQFMTGANMSNYMFNQQMFINDFNMHNW